MLMIVLNNYLVKIYSHENQPYSKISGIYFLYYQYFATFAVGKSFTTSSH